MAERPSGVAVEGVEGDSTGKEVGGRERATVTARATVSKENDRSKNFYTLKLKPTSSSGEVSPKNHADYYDMRINGQRGFRADDALVRFDNEFIAFASSVGIRWPGIEEKDVGREERVKWSMEREVERALERMQ
ncbi:hypothetical protein KM043_009549 [Ampulex compressa]|nr:hypothetical protein KM043_009549 [Ampulex compressa]